MLPGGMARGRDVEEIELPTMTMEQPSRTTPSPWPRWSLGRWPARGRRCDRAGARSMVRARGWIPCQSCFLGSRCHASPWRSSRRVPCAPKGIVARRSMAPPGESRSVPASVILPAATARPSARAQPRSWSRARTAYLPSGKKRKAHKHRVEWKVALPPNQLA